MNWRKGFRRITLVLSIVAAVIGAACGVPDYPSIYEKKYKTGISLMLKGIETDNTASVLEGAYTCNEFSDWINAHRRESSR